MGWLVSSFPGILGLLPGILAGWVSQPCGTCPLGSVPPPPPNLWELEAARKLRPGGSTARPGKVPAASRPCSRSVCPSHASCRKKHMPCLTLGRSRPPATQVPSPSTAVPHALGSTEWGKTPTLSPGSSRPSTHSR